MLRFLHAGDLHLESPLSAFSPRAAAARREGQYAAFEKLLAAGIERGAQLVLLSGDCFDTPTPNADAVQRFYRILGALPVPVVIAPGNHDYYTVHGPWTSTQRPGNVMVFETPVLSYFDFPELNTVVCGFAYTRETAEGPDIGQAADLPEGRIPLLMAHSDVASPLSSYAPISSGQLEQSGYAYAALGHIHKPMPAKRYGKTLTAYSGFFAGRGFDELGCGQARLVEVDENGVRELVIASEAPTFERRTLDCTGAQSATDVRTLLCKWIEELDLAPETALRVVLEGDVGLDCHVDTAVLAYHGNDYALFEVVDNTLPLYDAAYLEKAPTLQGAYYRALLPKLNSEDAKVRETAAAALRLGLSALAGREVQL